MKLVQTTPPTGRPARPSLAAALAVLGLMTGGCNRTQPAEPGAFDAGVRRAGSIAEAIGLMGTEKPPPEAPPTDADFVKLGKREIDWDLDPADRAMDYVDRYIQSTRRYGAERTCVSAQPSRVENGRTLVDTRDTSDHGCKGTGAVRDTFAVDIESDHLDLADPTRGAPLADWPDGSNPGGMPTPSPKEGPSIENWKSPIIKALQDLRLVPLRVQFYGRGSYPLLSIAGWHGAITLTSPPADLTSAAEKLCHASAGFPIGILATMDRSIVLRVRCPASGGAARWEHF
jgi:hypothetical protein